jgi:hypothetical protein
MAIISEKYKIFRKRVDRFDVNYSQKITDVLCVQYRQQQMNEKKFSKGTVSLRLL